MRPCFRPLGRTGSAARPRGWHLLDGGDRLGDQAVVVLRPELAAEDARRDLGRQPRRGVVELLDRRRLGELDLAAGAFEDALRLTLGLVLDLSRERRRVAPSGLDDLGRLGAREGQARLVLAQARLGLVAVALGPLE